MAPLMMWGNRGLGKWHVGLDTSLPTLHTTVKMSSIMEGTIDFEGQKTVEYIVKTGLIMSTFSSFVLGFVMQDVRVTFGILAVCVAGLTLAILPPWSTFNRHPVAWAQRTKQE